jgi:hypothetical protein
LSAVDELAVGDGWPGVRSAEQEIGEIDDASAAIEAVVPFSRIARQMLGADAVEGAVEPGLWTMGITASAFLPPSWTIE